MKTHSEQRLPATASPAPGRSSFHRLPSSVGPGQAPSVGLPLRFVLTGTVSLLIGIGLLVLRPDILATYHYNQYVIAATHLFALGWICSIVMGSMYQMVPVALEARLYSERIARWQFVMHLVGVAGMVAMFWVWNMKQVGHFGSIFGLGVILFAYNIGRTLTQIPRWNVIAVAIASAVSWLVLTMLVGLYLASAKCWPVLNFFSPLAQMHAHAHLGVLGFFVMMMVGVSYKLLPMFTLSEVQSERRAWVSVLLLNLGLLGAFLTILLESRWKFAFAVVIAAALILYGLEMAAILRARKRPALDWGVRYFLTAMALLAPAAVLGLVLAWPGLALTPLIGQLENLYGFLALLGVVSFGIMGMLYKIVPFLVWYARYSQEIGRSKVPNLADLYSPALQAWGFWLFLIGLAATCVAIGFGHEPAVRWSCGILAASVLLFALNLGRILRHMLRPSGQPLILNRPATGHATA